MTSAIYTIINKPPHKKPGHSIPPRSLSTHQSPSQGVPAGMSDETSSTHEPKPTNSSPANLPPEALALAERLFNAARTGDMTLLTTALTHNPGVRNLTNSKGDSLLMLASYHGHVDLTRELLQTYHADPNVLNARGQSPLAGAVFKNEPEILKLLIDAGADPDLGTPSAWDCLDVFSLRDRYGALLEGARDGKVES